MNAALEKLRSARRLGFLFSGGSTRCAFQVGVVETLVDLDIHPAMTLGVSAGAWNAAAVAVGNSAKLREYWEYYAGLPHVNLHNLIHEHTPFNWANAHRRAFSRYVGRERIRDPRTLPVYVAVTRLRDLASVVIDVRKAANPLRVLLATNYLPPFYTHPVTIDGEKYGDGGISDNLPYEALIERGADVVLILSTNGESDGGFYRSINELHHVIPPEFDDRLVVIRPRHRLPIGFIDWKIEDLERAMEIGRLRAREVLLDETYPETDVRGNGIEPLGMVLRAVNAARNITHELHDLSDEIRERLPSRKNGS